MSGAIFRPITISDSLVPQRCQKAEQSCRIERLLKHRPTPVPEIGTRRGDDSDAGTTPRERRRKLKGLIEGGVEDEPIETSRRHRTHRFSAVAGSDHLKAGAVEYPLDESPHLSIRIDDEYAACRVQNHRIRLRSVTLTKVDAVDRRG